jgi:AraC family transcriptional regulator
VSEPPPVPRSDLVAAGEVRPLGAPRAAPPVEFVRASYAPGLAVAKHAHSRSGLLVVLAGTVAERWGAASHEVGPLGLIFKPGGLPHSDVYGARGALCLIIGFDAAAFAALPEVPLALRPSRLAALALEAGDAARRGSRSLLLRIDELVAELELRLRGAAGPAPSGPEPRWLRRVVEAVEAGEVTRLAQAAELAGVHPSYVARAFRARHGRSLGEVARARRLERALAQVGPGGAPLADLAVAAGYADQSHLGRAFRRVLGTAPGRLRRAATAMARA